MLVVGLPLLIICLRRLTTIIRLLSIVRIKEFTEGPQIDLITIYSTSLVV